MKNIKIWWSDDRHKSAVFVAIYAIMPFVKWLQSLALGFPDNNFLVFRSSFYHLLHQQPLYFLYPSEHNDLFFYNPVFAFFFAPFALLPIPIGTLTWLVFLSFIFFKAAKVMPFRNGFLWLFLGLLIPEFSKNLGHLQPNILNCALMLFVFVSLEKKQLALAGFFCAALFCIKGYGVIVGALCFFYPKPWKTIAYGVLFLIILSALPLSIIPFSSLLNQYINWIGIIRSDMILESLSLIGFARQTLHWENSESFILGFGLLMLLAFWGQMLFHRASLTLENRLIFLGFLLMWVVAFNRSTESPTYLYAVVGLLIVYHFSEPTRNWQFIFLFCFWGMTVLPTDLSPQFLKNFDEHYFFRPLFLVPLMFYAFFKGTQRPIVSIT